MRCKFCSAPLPKSGLVCEYCGKRNPIDLEILPLKKKEKLSKGGICPVCKTSLERFNIGDKESFFIQRCPKCEGIFFENEELSRLLENINSARSIDRNMLHFVTQNPRYEREKGIVYKKCPICQEIMGRFNYKSVSGVIVDRCPAHGIWLDAGELAQLIEWKRAGGEIKAKEYEKKRNAKPKFTPRSDEPILFKNEQDDYNLLPFDFVDRFFRWIYGF